MGGGFNKIEPVNSSRIHQHLDVRNILLNYQWLGFVEKLRGFDGNIAQEFS